MSSPSLWLYPTKSTGAEEVINQLKKQAVVFGNPKRIVSNRGSAFTSSVLRIIASKKTLNIFKLLQASQELMDKWRECIKSLFSLLTKLSAPKPEEWYKHVDLTMKYIHSSYNQSIDRSAFELLFGTKMHLKEDFKL
ncbi:uncharacterized protein [Centruroides vittatus]|uniref:uncharacterized protein n=1 Tax=Centruroides vittatus TaxID=120091 RepID=UPI00350F93D1